VVPSAARPPRPPEPTRPSPGLLVSGGHGDTTPRSRHQTTHRRSDRPPLERFNREIGRRTDVVGIFPDDRSLIRLAGMLCIEANDEWLVGRRYLSAESISLVLADRGDHTDKEIKEEVPELQAA
jgi:hypothetical protein